MNQAQNNPPLSDRGVLDASHPSIGRAWRQILALTTAMTMVAGFVDAVGYINLGQFYLSFMSGNTTRFGIAIAATHNEIVSEGAAIIATFVLGAFIGSLLVFFASSFKLPVVLGCELLCFAAAYGLTAAGAGHLALLPIALAMGMQNAIHQVVSGADTGKSFITGSLFGVGDSLAKAVTGRAHYAQAAIHASSWIAFAGGVVLGALSLSHFGLGCALFIAMGVLIVMTIATYPGWFWFPSWQG